MAPTLYSRHQMLTTYGVSADHLQLYEARGLLQPKTVDGAACYTARDRIRLEIVLKGLRLGFSLHEISVIVTGQLAKSAARSSHAGFDGDRVADELRVLLVRQGCRGVTFDDLTALLRRQ